MIQGHAQRQCLPVALGYSKSPDQAGRDLAGEHALITLAQETGGKYYYADSSSLDRTFAQLSEDLRTQYLLGYYPSNRTGTGFRSISVKLRAPVTGAGYVLRNRPGYYPAPTP